MKPSKAEASVDGAVLAFKVPADVSEAIAAAAARELITKSAFARRAVLRDLQASGLKPPAAVAEAAA